MKKKLLIIVGTLLFFLQGFAVDFTYDRVTYTVIDENAKTVRTKAGADWKAGNDRPSTKLVLPEKVYNGETEYTLTEIGELSFYHTSITSLELPGSITIIGPHAFEECKSLETISFTESTSLLFIKEDAFSWCSKLKSLFLPKNIADIGQQSFYRCEGLESVTFTESLVPFEIGKYSFEYCHNLSTVVFAEGLTYIGYGSFNYCEKIESVTIPASVDWINSYAFRECNLTSVNFKDGSKPIKFGIKLFKDAQPYDLYLGREIVYDAEGQTIGLFNGAKTIEIGPNVKELPDDLFNGDTFLTNLFIPDNVQKIGNSVFNGCKSLVSAKIGKGCTSIGSGVFTDCSSLLMVTSLNPTPPTIQGATFTTNTTKNGRLLVPYGSKSRYMLANYWSEFFDIVELEEESGDSGNTGGNDSPGFTDESITDYIMMELDEEMNFADILPSNLSASAWETTNDGIVDITKRGKAEAYEFGHVYISAKDADDNVIAVYSVFVCPTVRVEHGNGIFYTHHVIYNTRPKFALAPAGGYKIAGVTHDGVEINNALVSNDGKYVSSNPITENSVINLSLVQDDTSGPTTGAGSVMSDSDVHIYVKGHLVNIVGIDYDTNVRMYNLGGKLLFDHTWYPNIDVIDAGVYIIEIEGQPNPYKIVVR